jgi:hypothetical protein
MPDEPMTGAAPALNVMGRSAALQEAVSALKLMLCKGWERQDIEHGQGPLRRLLLEVGRAQFVRSHASQCAHWLQLSRTGTSLQHVSAIRPNRPQLTPGQTPNLALRAPVRSWKSQSVRTSDLLSVPMASRLGALGQMGTLCETHP